ncbi:hypothetical protein PsYK624_088210 [Phanerochaete sordida]|uniref:Uncharacterized protein n=1 Tax=Phanerochaete sordida TaxID=48140 RepID=A0A9P3LEL9_9APHY|nr:hypothetical protein PsYK624_088210 [Phanerochaete sordida]
MHPLLALSSNSWLGVLGGIAYDGDAMNMLDWGSRLDRICGFIGPSTEELEHRELLEHVMEADELANGATGQASTPEHSEMPHHNRKQRARASSNVRRHQFNRRYENQKRKSQNKAKAATRAKAIGRAGKKKELCAA